MAAIARTLEVDAGPGQLRRPRRADPGGRRPSSATSKSRASLVYVSVVDADGHRRAVRRRSSPRTRGSSSSSRRRFQRGQQGKAMVSPSRRLRVAPGAGGRHRRARRASAGARRRASCSRWPASARSGRSRGRCGEGGLFDVYVVDSRGRLIAHSDPERLALGPRRLGGRDRRGSSCETRAGAPARAPCPSRIPVEGRRPGQDARHLHAASPTTRAGASSSRSTSRQGLLQRHRHAQQVAGPRGAS